MYISLGTVVLIAFVWLSSSGRLHLCWRRCARANIRRSPDSIGTVWGRMISIEERGRPAK